MMVVILFIKKSPTLVGFFVCGDDGYRRSAKRGQVDTKRLTGILVKFLDLGYG